MSGELKNLSDKIRRDTERSKAKAENTTNYISSMIHYSNKIYQKIR